MNDTSSKTPTPGGGSVSALVGALGTSMASMSANFTLGKEKFKDVGSKMKEILEKCKNDREELLLLMQEDIEAYNEVGKAYSLPKSNEDEKKQRSSAIQNALKKAIDTPLKIMRCSLGLLEYIDELSKSANPILITDIGVGGLLANAALKGAMLNVEINSNNLKNKDMVNNIREEIDKNSDRAEELIDDIMKKVRETVHKGEY